MSEIENLMRAVAQGQPMRATIDVDSMRANQMTEDQLFEMTSMRLAQGLGNKMAEAMPSRRDWWPESRYDSASIMKLTYKMDVVVMSKEQYDDICEKARMVQQRMDSDRQANMLNSMLPDLEVPK